MWRVRRPRFRGFRDIGGLGRQAGFGRKERRRQKKGPLRGADPDGLQSWRSPLVVDGSRSFAVFCFFRLPPGRLRVTCVRVGGCGSVASETVEGEAERLGLAERNAEGERRGRLRGARPNCLQSKRSPRIVDGSRSFAVFCFCRLPPGRLRVMCVRVGGCGSVASETVEGEAERLGLAERNAEGKRRGRCGIRIPFAFNPGIAGNPPNAPLLSLSLGSFGFRLCLRVRRRSRPRRGNTCGLHLGVSWDEGARKQTWQSRPGRPELPRVGNQRGGLPGGAYLRMA